jgi:hypothetical protein
MYCTVYGSGCITAGDQQRTVHHESQRSGEKGKELTNFPLMASVKDTIRRWTTPG